MSRKIVLFVDDEANMLSSLGRLLRKEDYKLLTALSAKEGLALLEKEVVHVVISDQKMPEMRGTEFLQRVKALYPDTVRVVLSGDADLNVIVDAINKDEVYRFLPKPWNDEELKVAIRQCLAYYDLVQQNRSLLDRVRAQNEELKRLNEGLENTVTERTRSLLLSQAILAKLPVPVLGVSPEGMIALVNEVVGKVFPPLRQISLGTDARDVFPFVVIERIDRCLRGGMVEQPASCEILGTMVKLQVIPLKEADSMMGCILMLTEV